MEEGLLYWICGWAAVLSAGATLGTFLTGVLFFVINQKYGWVNDLFSVIQVLLMIPLVYLFNQQGIPANFSARMISTLLGLGGILITAYGQIRLLAGKIDFEGSRKFIPAGGAIGLWLVAVNLSSFTSGQYPGALLWIGLAAGLGYLLTLAGFFGGGPKSPLFFGGGLLLGICYPIWGIWLGLMTLANLA